MLTLVCCPSVSDFLLNKPDEESERLKRFQTILKTQLKGVEIQKQIRGKKNTHFSNDSADFSSSQLEGEEKLSR